MCARSLECVCVCSGRYSLIPEAAAPLAILLAAAVRVVVWLVVQRTDEVLVHSAVRHLVVVAVLADLWLCKRNDGDISHGGLILSYDVVPQNSKVLGYYHVVTLQRLLSQSHTL